MTTYSDIPHEKLKYSPAGTGCYYDSEGDVIYTAVGKPDLMPVTLALALICEENLRSRGAVQQALQYLCTIEESPFSELQQFYDKRRAANEPSHIGPPVAERAAVVEPGQSTVTRGLRTLLRYFGCTEKPAVTEPSKLAQEQEHPDTAAFERVFQFHSRACPISKEFERICAPCSPHCLFLPALYSVAPPQDFIVLAISETHAAFLKSDAWRNAVEANKARYQAVLDFVTSQFGEGRFRDGVGSDRQAPAVEIVERIYLRVPGYIPLSRITHDASAY